MTLEEIKRAVESGEQVCHGNDSYRVIKDKLRDGGYQWLIHYIHTDYYIGLTWADGKTLNGKPDDFYILKQPNA